ncbi:hypothetical protein GGI21_002013 [Coemansia aciculifera]|uniref:Uncharacterized protein n=1 Tax=Coemansia aciculifera TaxID=417176 RepID=A0ACC1M2S4_9FUNG|nr:hypothetical protein IWW38_002722 [Coemansia aciculifera]KAJ2909308.1 hypothetical protein GGI21_002013 [Coemansia aciculifera]
MRKTSTLKTGLNMPKQGAAASATKPKEQPNTAQPKKSVFAELDASSNLAKQTKTTPTFSGGSQTRASEKLAQELQAADPTVYAYDEVYDDISDARDRSKRARKQADDLKPRYMERILETAKQRQVQHEVVREKMLDKEREREGDMFADKETFVTDAYKEHKEQRQKLVEEEDKREASEASTTRHENGATISTGFYRGFLDQIDRDDVSKFMASNADAPSQTRATETSDLVGVRGALAAGLNVTDGSVRPRRTQASTQEPTIDYDLSKDSLPLRQRTERQQQAQSSRSSYSRTIEEGLNTQQQLKDEERLREHNALVKKYARRNDAASVEAARQRYLARKQQLV